MTTVTVTDRSALAAALRELKLSGMLATLDARLAQAHAGELGHLDFLRYGVGTAQRGWLSADDVINTWPLARLREFLRKPG